MSPGTSFRIKRPAVVALLREGQNKSLTLVSAPAGYGKSTVLAEYMAAPGQARFVYLPLTHRDLDAVHLLDRLESALGGSPGSADASTPALVDGMVEASVEPALRRILGSMGSAEQDLVVVLDDYHVAESADVNAVVEALIAYGPQNLHLLVSTRKDPPLGLGHLRVVGDLTEVRASDLRFSRDDIAAFLVGAGIHGVSTTDLHRLEVRTLGWPATVQLAALLMRGSSDRDAVIDSFTGSHRIVVDYMTSDMLDLLPESTQDFLLSVSVLEQLNSSLCDAVVGTNGSGAVLEDLERANYFVSSGLTNAGLVEPGATFHLHGMFAEALRVELRRTRPELEPVLHQRAAEWFERSGDLESAMQHAIAGRDVGAATRLLNAQVHVLIATGRMATATRWLHSLSWPEALADPELAYARAVLAGLANQLDDCAAWLDVASRGPRDLLDSSGVSLGYRIDYLTSVILVNDLGKAVEAGRRAVAESTGARLESIPLAGIGQAQYLRGELPEALESLERAIALLPDVDPIMLAIATANAALVELALDQSKGSIDRLDGAMETLVAIGADGTPAGVVVRTARGAALCSRGDVRKGIDELERAVDLVGAGARNALVANALLLLADAHRRLGEGDLVMSTLDQAAAVIDRLPDPGAMPERLRLARLTARHSHRGVVTYGDELSEREISVLELAAAGLSQREIGAQLFISYNTVKSHMRTSYRKLGVESKAEAVERFNALYA